MKFRKIDDHKIHCIISQEEMNEKGIALEDFLDHRDKTEEFLREILDEARYELDLEDMGHFYSVQMAVMPEGDVSLVISGEDHDSSEGALAELGKHLQDFKEIMEEAKAKLEQKHKDTQEQQDTIEPQNAAGQKKEVMNTPLWVEFPTLESCIEACRHMKCNKISSSEAYKYNDTYYLRICFVQEEHRIAGILLVMSEYSTQMITEDQGGFVIAEHGTLLCKERAIETLKSL